MTRPLPVYCLLAVKGNKQPILYGEILSEFQDRSEACPLYTPLHVQVTSHSSEGAWQLPLLGCCPVAKGFVLPCDT